MNRWPIPYSKFLKDNFRFVSHKCGSGCACHSLGCTEHWDNGGKVPNVENMRYILATWQAFRNKPGCQSQFTANYLSIAKLAMPLSRYTLFCSWDSNEVAEAYDRTREILSHSVVCTTKTLHFFAPDLFLILDRIQVYRPWRAEVRTPHINPLGGLIDGIDGRRYVTFMSRAREKLASYIEQHQPIVLGRHSYGIIHSVDQLRHLSPIRPNSGAAQPNTVGKVLDNLMRGVVPEP